MKRLSRYILRIHATPFLMGTLTVLFLFFFQFLLKVIDQLLGKGLNEWVIMEFFFVNMAWMLVLAVPMGVLFSTLMSFGSMSAAHEVTIVKASGGSLLRMMFPVIISGMIISFALFWFNDEILPEANHRAKILMNDIKKTRPTFSIDAGQFSTELSGYTILARSVDSTSGLLKGLTIYDNSQRDYSNVISADSGFVRYNEDYTKLILDLTRGEIHQSVPFFAKNYRRVNFEKYKIQIDAKGFVFEESGADVVSRGDREMHISDMQKIVDESDKMAVTAMLDIDKNLSAHLDYLLYGEKKTDTVPERSVPVIKKIYSEVPVQNQNDTTIKAAKITGRQQLSAKATVKPADLPVAENAVEGRHGRMANLAQASPAVSPVPENSAPVPAVQESRKDTIDRVTAITQAQKKVSFIRSSISSNVYQNNDYVSKSRQYEVEIYKKYAIPFACLIFVFVGCPLGIMTKGGNFGLSAAISLGFYILYWACLIMGEKLADRGLMSPLLSMWMGNYIIGILGIILTLRVNYERFGTAFIKKLFFRKRLIPG